VDWRRNSRRSDDRRPPVESSSAPNASVRRNRAFHRPTRPGHVGSASPLFFYLKDGVVHPPTGAEEWRGLRSSRARAAGSRHRDGRLRPKRLSGPAVPGRRSTAGTSPRARVSHETICVYLRDLWANCDGWVALCALCVSVVVRVVLGLRVFVFATWWEGRSFRVSRSSSCFAPCASPPRALSSSV